MSKTAVELAQSAINTWDNWETTQPPNWRFDTMSDYKEILDVLAANDGACLYWQLPNQPLVKSAIATDAIRFDGATDLAIHPDAVANGDGGWRMPKQEN